MAPGGADTGGRAQWYPGPCGKKGRWDTAPGERGGKDTGLESRMPGGGRGGQRGYRGGTGLPNSPSAPSPSPAVCLGAPEGRGVTDQPSFPRREALAPGSQSVLAASQCPNLKM